jgi:predicted transposase YdaD
MAKTKDILCKVWLRRGSDGILSRRICSGKIAEQLPTEQPQISNRQADMLIRNERDELHHVEFQASNESDFGFRMLEYWVYFRREHGQAVRQCVFYIGTEPMRLAPVFEEGGTRHAFDVVNLQEYDASDLLASADWGDNLWALGAKGDRPGVLKEILAKLLAMTREEQEPALAELTAFSGILKLDDLLSQKLKEFPMLTVDLKENAVVRPLIEEGRQEGRLEGRLEGRRALLLDLLAEKFGAIPTWAAERVQAASIDQLDRWARKVLHNTTLDDILG